MKPFLSLMLLSTALLSGGVSLVEERVAPDAPVSLHPAKIENSQGIGFSVPSNQVREFLGNVLEGDGQPVE